MLTEIRNFLALSPQLLTAGQPTAEQFGELRAAGVEVVVNLAMPTSTNALPNERAIVEGLGMTYIPIPVVWETPTRENFEQFSQVLDAHRDRTVLVHCALNMRVSAFVYTYRVLRGMEPAIAQADLAKIWQPNAPWQAFIDSTLTSGNVSSG